MKRIFSLILAFTIMISLCGCGGSFGSVNLSDSIPIPDDGLIQESLLEQIQKENAIAVFTGESNGLRYEWTIFGSDIAEPKEINLTVELSKRSDGSIQSRFPIRSPSGFPPCSPSIWTRNGLRRVPRLIDRIRRSLLCLSQAARLRF